MSQITNPILKYYGSKFRLAKWIIEHFPKHQHYVEPFGGGASILLQKPVSQLETYNDLDKNVVNFFRVLRKMPHKLAKQIELTPWSRDEFEVCLTTCNDRLEDARRLYFRLWMSLHAGTRCESARAWRRHKNRQPPASGVKLQVLFEAAKRLRTVQIENCDAVKLISDMDSTETLFYIDPPYLATTRTDKKRYAIEMNQDEQHQALAKAILDIKGLVVLSGYPSKLYEKLFERYRWKRIDKTTRANGGHERVESLWLSPKTYKALIETC